MNFHSTQKSANINQSNTMKTSLYWTSPLFGSDIACVACVRCARNACEWVTLVIVTRRVRDTSHVRSQVEDMDSPSVCPAPGAWSRVTMCGPAHDLTHVWSVDHSMGLCPDPTCVDHSILPPHGAHNIISTSRPWPSSVTGPTLSLPHVVQQRRRRQEKICCCSDVDYNNISNICSYISTFWIL